MLGKDRRESLVFGASRTKPTTSPVNQLLKIYTGSQRVWHTIAGHCLISVLPWELLPVGDQISFFTCRYLCSMFCVPCFSCFSLHLACFCIKIYLYYAFVSFSILQFPLYLSTLLQLMSKLSISIWKEPAMFSRPPVGTSPLLSVESSC